MGITSKVFGELLLKGIIIGSYGLEVNDNDSDLDIVISKKNLPKTFEDDYETVDPSKYFNVMPMKNIWLYKKVFIGLPFIKAIEMDILVYDDETEIKAIEKIIDAMKSTIDRDTLKNKESRITLFESIMLLNYPHLFKKI